MVKTKSKMEIVSLRLIIFFAFVSGDVAMTEQLRWIARMPRKLVDADSFI
jgi:hypothetical protein